MRIVTPHWLDRPEHQWLVRLRPRAEMSYCAQGRTVFAAGLNGMINGGREGLFAYQTRLLSRYRHLINGEVPETIAVSNVEQHSWLGYYGVLSPGVEDRVEEKSMAQHTLELRVSRYVGGGVHEDLDFTNFTQFATSFSFEIEVDADFADPSEVESGKRWQTGEQRSDWSQDSQGRGTLSFDYSAEHTFDVQGNRGTARLQRSVKIVVAACDSPPQHEAGRI